MPSPTGWQWDTPTILRGEQPGDLFGAGTNLAPIKYELAIKISPSAQRFAGRFGPPLGGSRADARSTDGISRRRLCKAAS